MADVLANGFGTVAGSRAAPVTLLSSISIVAGVNFVTIVNTDATNWLFIKNANDPNPYVIALPGASATIAFGPQSSNNVKGVVGFAATPSEAGTATLTAVMSAFKFA